MVTKVQGIQPYEWLLTESAGSMSRSQVTVTIAGGVALPHGTVVGKITATGKYIKAVDGAADGSMVNVAILCNDLEGVNGDKPAVVIDQGAELFGAMLNNGAGATALQKAALVARGLKVR